MFVKVIEQNLRIFYIPVTELHYIIEEGNFVTIVMKNGEIYRSQGSIFLPSTD